MTLDELRHVRSILSDSEPWMEFKGRSAFVRPLGADFAAMAIRVLPPDTPWSDDTISRILWCLDQIGGIEFQNRDPARTIPAVSLILLEKLAANARSDEHRHRIAHLPNKLGEVLAQRDEILPLGWTGLPTQKP